MAKYDFDSYPLYEAKRHNVHVVKVRVILTETIKGDVLKEASEKAFRRFSYYQKSIDVDKEGGLLLIDNDKPICVFEGDNVITLGSKETNGLLFAISYEKNNIYFNFAHNFCGVSGAMPWIKATLYYYLIKLGHNISRTAIMREDDLVTKEECAEPDVNSLPNREALGSFNFTRDSFTARTDYFARMQDPNGTDRYYPISIPKDQFMNYVKRNDGSPISILSALFLKMVARAQPNEQKFTVGIANNYRADVGCQETYRDMIRNMYVQYDAFMADWSIAKLSTITRGSMFLQIQPEISYSQIRKVDTLHSNIDKIIGLDKKADYAIANSLLINAIPFSYFISYVGKVDWGDLAPFILGVYTLTFGHLVFEINATNDKFCITFQTVRKDDLYLKEFLQILEQEGFSYSIDEPIDRKLPKMLLP